ncbi:MAG: preprotein translocase subunit SecE [bacterium]|nr:preprotein translocase subunit SecE [bacterium]
MAKVVKSTREVVDIDQKIKDMSKNKKTSPKVESVEKNKKSLKNKVNGSKKKKSFLHGVRREVSMVKWPSKKDMVKYSVATIGFILFFALFFYVIELILALLKMGV